MNASKILDIVSNGVPFRVRVITQGDKHGLNDCITHKSNVPIVEFYDRRFNHSDNGQFASSYYLTTLLERDMNVGLCLHGGVPDWSITQEAMAEVIDWLEQFSVKEIA